MERCLHIRLIALLALVLVAELLRAQVIFVPNEGQWEAAVQHRAELPGSYFYLDNEGFTVQLLEDDFFKKLHDFVQGTGEDSVAMAHALKFRFEGANLTEYEYEGKSISYSLNYFLGDDPELWATDLKGNTRIKYSEVYPGVALRMDGTRNKLKYEFIAKPHADISPIKLRIDGANEIKVQRGDLVIQTDVGEYRELKPFAYQLTADGAIEKVRCEYKLQGNTVTYHFPKGYDPSRELVIDPELVFSSYLGSLSNNFGFTASYDGDGNLYAGSIVFGAEYPTTAGAYMVFFAGGTIDIGITKFNNEGTELIYSTFLGGSGNEAPHSIVVSPSNELYVMGSTGSANFPVTPGVVQSVFAGGPTVNGAGYVYGNGSDIFIARFSAAGNGLIASTYLGGSGNDGVSTGTLLDYNYADRFRGEIVVDFQGNPYIASVTNSINFPIVNGYSSVGTTVLSGVVVKLNAALTSIAWSTYIGGSSPESAISLQLAADNSVYVTGGTTSTNLPVSPGAYQSAYSGNVDGYIAHISSDGSALLHCTYNGTIGFDQNYFVQIDEDGFVYVVGQSTGAYPITPGVYSNPNSGQFVHKFSPDLTTSVWSTEIGTGTIGIDFTPSAFLVSNCGQIYVSGWGGSVNTAGGSTAGLPVTSNAFQSTTDGSDFYLMVLGVDANDLVYATFFGGSQSSEHVDGGTSRFDKNGTVYQAVCAGCWNNSDFPTQNGVWSQVNPSAGCNLGVFKFRLGSVKAIASVNAPGAVCTGAEVSMLNQSIDADTFIWNFGDGSSSTETNPVHTYAEPGTYIISLYAESSDGCLIPDSISIELVVEPSPQIEVTEPGIVCPGGTVQLEVSGADSWLWSPPAGLNFINVANPIFSGSETTLYTITGSTTCGSASATLLVTVAADNVEISENIDFCPGSPVQLTATGGVSYQWSPPTGLSNPNIANPIATVQGNAAYAVTVITEEGCTIIETVNLFVLTPPPVLMGNSIYVACNGVHAQISITGADWYAWNPATGLSNPEIGNPTASPQVTTVYTVTGYNECGEDSKEITVLVNSIELDVQGDTLVCFDAPFVLSASGGVSYYWEPSHLVNPVWGQQTVANIPGSTLFRVYGSDDDGCSTSATIFVETHPRSVFRAGNDRVINIGDRILIESFSTTPITWEFSEWLSCTSCQQPWANPPVTTAFYAGTTTEEGCLQTDSVKVMVRGGLHVPNAFSPNGDGINDIFRAVGTDISEFRMEIFDRWGERVFRSDDISQGWNGSHQGSEYYVPAGLYPYKIVARERYGEVFEMNGFVMVLR